MGMFDDLIPNGAGGNPRPPSRGMFEDLIPFDPNMGKPQPKIIPLDNAPQNPQERQFAQDLLASHDRELLANRDLGQGYAALSSFGNALGMNIPRNVAAGVRSLQTGQPFGDEYAYVKSIDEAAARQFPKTSAAGTVVGAVTGAAALPAANATMGARALLGGATGAGMAGVSELADTKDPGKALQAAGIGGVVGGVAAPVAEKLISGPVNAIGRAVAKKPVIPTTDELKASSQAAYKASESAGLILKPQGVQGLASDLQQTLAAEGYHPRLGNQSKLQVVIDELGNLGSGNVTLKGLDVIRKMANAAKTDIDPSTRRLGAMAVEKVDDFLTNLNPSDILTGDKQQGVKALQEARSLWSSYRKADMVDEALQVAQQRAASTGSGGNVDNAIRQEFRKILQNRKKSAAFTDKEKAELAKIVTGAKGQNTLRLLGKLSPAGDGLRLMLNTGAAVGSGGATVPISILGAGAKALADRATPQNVERLSKIIRARGQNIDPEDVIKAQQSDRLKNFFTSIGINVDQMIQNEAE
jgi:hypothetical protein